MRRHYELIDVTKFVMAVMVIGIHANSIVREGYPFWLSFLMGTAVPFFFITSGFLLAEHTELKKKAFEYVTQQKFFSYIKKIFIFYLCWTILYSPLAIWSYNNNETPWFIDCLLYIRGLIFLGEHPYSWPLWYLWTLCCSCFIIRLAFRFNIRLEVLFLAGLLLMYGGYKYESVSIEQLDGFRIIAYRTYHIIFENTRNVFCQGLAYVTAGMMLQKYELLRHKWLGIILLSTSYTILLLKWPFAFLLSGVGLFIIMGSFPLPQNIAKYHSHFITLRKMSVWMYFLHMYFIFFISLMLDDFNHLYSNVYGIWILATLLTICLSLMAYKFSLLNKGSWLRYLA